MQNAINWFEIPAANLDRAIQFYSTIFGAEVAKRDFNGDAQGFFSYDGADAVGGALVQNDGYVPSPNGTVVYLNARSPENLDAVLSRVEAAGGKVVLGRTPIGDPGFIGFIMDTEGNKIGLHAPNSAN